MSTAGDDQHSAVGGTGDLATALLIESGAVLASPLDPAGPHPVARAIRSGEPALIADLTASVLRSFARSSEHARSHPRAA